MALKNKCIYRLMIEDNSSQQWYKVRLVVNDFDQKKNVDFKELW